MLENVTFALAVLRDLESAGGNAKKVAKVRKRLDSVLAAPTANRQRT